MKRTFVTNLALLLFLNLLIKPFWIFVIEVNVQNRVGEENYGFYFALLNFSLLLNILLDLGITNYNNRNIAQNQQLLSKHVSNIVPLKFMLAVFYFIISISIALIIGYDISQMKLLFFLIFNQFLLSFILYLRSNISGIQLFKTDSLLSVLDRTVMIIICCILLWGNVTDDKFHIEWLVYVQTGAYLFTAFVVFLIVSTKCEFLKPRFDWRFFIVFLKQSYPYAFLILLMMFYNRIDSVLLERLLPGTTGEQQAGVYAQGFRFLDAFVNFGLLFASLLLPMFAKMIKQKEPIVQLVQLAFLFLFIPGIIIAVASVSYRNEIMEFFYPEHTPVTPVIFSILMFSFIFTSTGTYIFGALLTANGSMKHLNIMAIIAISVNIIANIIIIPIYGALGSAIVNLVTQVFTWIVQLYLAIKIFGFKINTRLIILLCIYILFISFFGIYFKALIPSWFTGILLLGITGFLLAFFLKLWNIKTIYEIIRDK
ncbi:MAG: oligosaccharide flippase family protein [Bacteroidia bacterium]|nr:oligosaccharide flippase family protein [Bacteroidia bacterium]